MRDRRAEADGFGAVGFGPPADDPLAARLFPPLPGEVKWGLERTERLLAALGDPHRAYPVLHVGGTNGKGSVARVWAEILCAAGFRTGLYTSPHLVSWRERCLVNGRPLPDARMEEWARDLRPLLLREQPSFFEASTVLAFLAFARAEVDVAVIEVGLGGRLDTTNVVSPVLTAITNVAYEHHQLLGKGLTTIAREKAGILKPGVPLFTASDDPAVLAVFAEEAAACGAMLRRVRAPEGQVRLEGSTLRLQTGRWGALELSTPLAGQHQMHNVALAVRSLEALPPRLPVSAVAVVEGVGRARVPGRFQVERARDQTWALDVAHNAHAAGALATLLGSVTLPSPRIGLIGILRDKAWPEMLRELSRVLDHLVLTTPGTAPLERQWDPVEGAAGLPADRVRAIPAFDEAFEAAREASGPSGSVTVAGSSYTVGRALRLLDRVPSEALPVSSNPG